MRRIIYALVLTLLAVNGARAQDLPELTINPDCLISYKQLGAAIIEVEASYNAAVRVINQLSDAMFQRDLAQALTEQEMLQRITVMDPPFDTVAECRQHEAAAQQTLALRQAHFLAACDTIALLMRLMDIRQ